MQKPPDGFERLFRLQAARLRRRLVARAAVSWAALAALAGAAIGAAAWTFGQGEVRRWALLAPLAGALLGAYWAQRRRWSDSHVALFLDARLATAEAVTSALAEDTGVTQSSQPSERWRALRSRAAEVLRAAEPKQVRVRWLLPQHAVLPLGIALGVWLCFQPLPPARAEAQGPGSELVRQSNVAGLDRVEALERAPGLSESDAERLRQLAREARKLRSDLARGLERREAQARVAKLRDDVAAERQRFGDASERAAVDAAVGALGAEPSTRSAAKALGEGDLVAFDEEMQRLANQAETRAREAARRALEDALQSARASGGKRLSALLERQAKAFAEHAARASALRELAEQLKAELDPQARSALQQFGETGSLEAQQGLIEGMERALQGLSEAERQKLAENLKRQLALPGGEATLLERAELESLARKLATAEGQRALSEQLKELARSSPDSERERALEDAERGGAEAQRGLGAIPVPNAGAAPSSSPGMGSSAGSGKPDGNPTGANASNGPGAGKAEHEGQTAELRSKELRSKANAQLLPGAPLGTPSLGRAPARAGESANQLGTSDLGGLRAAEVSAVEGADIPEAYREQVGRYFEP